MKTTSPIILSLNGGSSSIRFAIYRLEAMLERLLHGKLDRIGTDHARLTFSHGDGQTHEQHCEDTNDYPSAVASLVKWIYAQEIFVSISAIGHRVVHGMHHLSPEIVTQELIDELRNIALIDPEHMPDELDLIEAFRARVPTLPQVVCFDTTFHQHMPNVATTLAIPRRYSENGIRRYGFHGLSYAYLMEELERIDGGGNASAAPTTHRRVILAHLGHGASMTAVQDGKSIDTTMGFTPASGLPMGTRSGDIDPGLVAYLARTEKMSPVQFAAMINHESGLLGVSETSSDIGDLLALEATDSRAAEAIALFCYQAKKQIGAYAAALGGLDTLVFAGGIGENSAIVRERICAGPRFLGIELNASRNEANADVISTDTSQVAVRVIRTDEELIIARFVCRVLGYTSQTGELQP